MIEIFVYDHPILQDLANKKYPIFGGIWVFEHHQVPSIKMKQSLMRIQLAQSSGWTQVEKDQVFLFQKEWFR